MAKRKENIESEQQLAASLAQSESPIVAGIGERLQARLAAAEAEAAQKFVNDLFADSDINLQGFLEVVQSEEIRPYLTTLRLPRVGSANEVPTEPKRRRGRPAGSKNKAKAKRGRPRKTGKKRGRPPGSKNKPRGESVLLNGSRHKDPVAKGDKEALVKDALGLIRGSKSGIHKQDLVAELQKRHKIAAKAHVISQTLKSLLSDKLILASRDGVKSVYMRAG